jgi:hypothetical protein
MPGGRICWRNWRTAMAYRSMDWFCGRVRGITSGAAYLWIVVHHLGDPGGVGQQVSHGRGPEAGLGGDQAVGAQVLVGGRVDVDQPLLPQLHHGNRREGLGDGGDAKTVSSVTGVFDAMSATPCP